MNKRKWSIVQLLHLISITFLFILRFFVKRHANFGRYRQTFLAPFTHRFPFDTKTELNSMDKFNCRSLNSDLVKTLSVIFGLEEAIVTL